MVQYYVRRDACRRLSTDEANNTHANTQTHNGDTRRGNHVQIRGIMQITHTLAPSCTYLRNRRRQGHRHRRLPHHLRHSLHCPPDQTRPHAFAHRRPICVRIWHRCQLVDLLCPQPRPRPQFFAPVLCPLRCRSGPYAPLEPVESAHQVHARQDTTVSCCCHPQCKRRRTHTAQEEQAPQEAAARVASADRMHSACYV